MRATLLILTFALATQASAQTGLAESRETKNTPAAGRSNYAFSAVASEPTKPRVFDRKFLLLTAIATTATVLDMTTTSHCLSTYANCREGNPLLGSHPSQAKLYSISLSTLAGEMFASAWLRREMPHRKVWIIAPIMATVGHGTAAALNARAMHQLDAGASR
jgi:hypothetical protein